jgi:hypothetical protein
MVRVLADFGYHVNPDGADHEQQFSCDLHGDGRDTKKSARYYPSSNSIYCWACGRARDSITLIREKKGVSFHEAASWLERQYGLPELPWEAEEQPKAVEIDIARVTDPGEGVRRLERALRIAGQERCMSAERLAVFWETHDGLAYLLHQGEDISGRPETVLEKLRQEMA